MIKIDIDAKTKKDIEEMYLRDARSAGTGLFKILSRPDVKAELQKEHTAIYNTLYHSSTGDLKEKEVEKLLLADQKELRNYISMFGRYSGSTDKSDYLLNSVFKYKNFANRRIAYHISSKRNVTVCPYCNRQYVFTVIPSKGRVRPQFDHYFPKKDYPYLALSLYNMIPSCSICNMAKSSLDTRNYPILYPFDEEMGYSAKFEFRIKEKGNFVQVLQGLSDQFEIHLDSTQAAKAAEIQCQMEELHLDALYNEHTDYVKDIIRSKYVNTSNRIREIQRSFPKLFHSCDEVKNMLYMTDLRKEYWGKRPLSKLTHDIDKQLEDGASHYVKRTT